MGGRGYSVRPHQVPSLRLAMQFRRMSTSGAVRGTEYLVVRQQYILRHARVIMQVGGEGRVTRMVVIARGMAETQPASGSHRT